MERIAAERDEARSAMARRLGKKRLRRVRKESRARFPLPSGKKRRMSDVPLPGRARERLEGRIDDLLNYEPVIPDADAVDVLHDARIAVKRLRYTLELFEGAIGDDAMRLIQDTKDLQEVLGKLHDLDVSVDLVAGERDAHADAAESADPQLAASLEAVLVRDRAARRKLHDDVVACWEELMADGFRERLARVTAWR